MNVAQNVSAVFNSPEIAEMVLQAVQAGELAELQGLADLRRDTERARDQVRTSAQAAGADGVAHRPAQAPGPSPYPRGRRRQASAPEPEKPGVDGPGPGDGHRIDLVA